MERDKENVPEKQSLQEELLRVGMAALLRGRFQDSAWCLDSALRLYPEAAPTLWQRGLSCFYTGRYGEGAVQFASDMKYNSYDAEEVLWNFACRCKARGFAESSREGFLELSGRPTVSPMAEVLDFFKGRVAAEDVFAAATSPDGTTVKSYNDTNALAYAHFYVGLYHELQGDLSTASTHLRRAAEMKNPDFVGRLMVMHFDLFQKITLPKNSLAVFRVGDAATGYPCTSVIHGGWQFSRGHLIGAPELHKSEMICGLLQAYFAGIRAFTCGDIYTGIEELYGDFIRAHCMGGGRPEDLAIHTTLVPDMDAIRAGKVDRAYVRSVVKRSLNRFGLKSLNLVQFFWWDTTVDGWLEAAQALSELRGEGLIQQIGVTNFSTEETRALLDAGVPIAVTQIQYSLLDQRPVYSGLVDLCEERGIKILPYGVLAGGFLTETWLGKPCPDPSTLPNRSLVKYWLIIQEFGGWELFQQLLVTLRRIADRHTPPATPAGLTVDRVTIAMVAMQYILSQRQVGGVITGAHHNRHTHSTVAATHLRLTEQDHTEIAGVLGQARGPRGAVFGLERVRGGTHGRVLWQNLSQLHQGPHLEELCHRFIKLMFQACPVEATRMGYRLPPPASYRSLCHDLCTELAEGTCTFDCELIPLLAQRACSYDHLLNISSELEISEHCQKVRSLLEEANDLEQSVSSSTLTPDQLVDLKIITSQLRLQLVKWQQLQQHRRDPGLYLPLSALLHLLPTWGPDPSLSGPSPSGPTSLQELSHPGVSQLTVAERLVALLSRLQAIPRVLENAAVNLTSPVSTFVQTALEVCSSFQPFLEACVPELCTTLVFFDPSLRSSGTAPVILEKIALASRVAALAVGNYASFLSQRLLPKSRSDAAIGKEVYEQILQLEHFIDSSDELLAMGDAHFREVKAALESLAREIDPTRTWQELTEQVIQPIHPTAEDLLADFMSEIHRAQWHTIDHKLVSGLPEGERVVGFYTSKFLTPFSPFGDFLNPSPFAGMDRRDDEAPSADTRHHVVGHLHLHPVERGSTTEQEMEECLRTLNHTFITVVAPHESYPGHHVQALLAQTHPRLLRRYYESILFYEGWGLYTEELAYETGFFEKEHSYKQSGTLRTISAVDYSKLARLTQLRLRLWRAARILLDVRLNTGQMSFQQCQDFLQKEVMFGAKASRGEAFIYLSRPGYASCYVAGFLMLLQVREKAKQKCAQAGKPFSLQDFHHSLLSKGCLPFKLLDLIM